MDGKRLAEIKADLVRYKTIRERLNPGTEVLVPQCLELIAEVERLVEGVIRIAQKHSDNLDPTVIVELVKLCE